MCDRSPGPGLVPHLAGPDSDSGRLRPAAQRPGGGREAHQQARGSERGDRTVGF